jgi:hypothetical protein
MSRSGGEPQEGARRALIAGATRKQSHGLACIDGFMLLAITLVAALLPIPTLKDSPEAPDPQSGQRL